MRRLNWKMWYQLDTLRIEALIGRYETPRTQLGQWDIVYDSCKAHGWNTKSIGYPSSCRPSTSCEPVMTTVTNRLLPLPGGNARYIPLPWCRALNLQRTGALHNLRSTAEEDGAPHLMMKALKWGVYSLATGGVITCVLSVGVWWNQRLEDRTYRWDLQDTDCPPRLVKAATHPESDEDWLEERSYERWWDSFRDCLENNA